MKREPEPHAAPDRLARLAAEVQQLREQLAVETDERELLERTALEAQQALELSREHYADLYDAAPTGFLSLDRTGFIHEANLTAATMLGMARPRLLMGKVLLAHFVVKQDQRKLLTHLRLCRQAPEQQVVTELTLAHHDRPALEVQLVSVPDHRLSRTAAQLRFRTTVVDITARKKADEALRQLNATLEQRVDERTAALQESETRFRTLVQGSSDVIYRMSSDWTEMRQLVGRKFIADTQEPSRTWLQKYIPQDDQKRVMTAIHEAIRTRSVFELEHRIIRVDGSLSWIFSRAIPLLDAKGEITEWFGMAEDITERKDAAERIFKLSRVQAILTGVNRAIAYIAEQQPLLDEICRLAVAEGGFKLAWVGLVAQSGATAYLENIRIVTADVPEGRGPVGTAIRENRPVISEDTKRTQHRSPLFRRAMKFGLRFSTAFPIRMGDKVIGSFQVFASQPGFFEEAELNLLGQVTEDISHALTAFDVAARRRQAEASLQEANRTLQTIHDCHEAILRAETESALLNEICRIIVRTGGGRMAWVGYAENDARKRVRVMAATGGETYLKSIRITWADKPRGRGPVGTVIRTGRVCICPNTQTDPNFAPWRQAARRYGLGSVIALPLIMDGRCQGALCIYARETDAFDAAEQLLLTDLANDLAFGVFTLRLRAERTRLEGDILKSIEREQERIGRDLHDGLGQLLVGLKFRCGYLQGISTARLADVKNEARKMETILNQAILQTREMARELNPANVTLTSLAQALRNLCAETSASGGPKCVCKMAGTIEISDHDVAGHLFRIAQEALQNALKHARAKNITISLKWRGRNIVLCIEDDGTGMPLRVRESGMGMSNMGMRASLISGRLEITRRKHGGTTVTCEFTPRNRAKDESAGVS